jgi:hypothetical protein
VRETWRIVGWNESGDWMIEYKDGVSKWFDDVEEVDEDTSVRWWEQCTDDCDKAKIPTTDDGDYRFDDEHPCPTRWRPAIFMSRWMTRIITPVLNVRVERLQDITNNDAVDEGTPDLRTVENNWDMRDCYFHLWNEINTMPASKNPWIWVYEFPLVE